jgi:hypothetical protein
MMTRHAQRRDPWGWDARELNSVLLHLSLHPSDGRFGQLMLPKVRGHRMVPDRAEAVKYSLPLAANCLMAMAKALPMQISRAIRGFS